MPNAASSLTVLVALAAAFTAGGAQAGEWLIGSPDRTLSAQWRQHEERVRPVGQLHRPQALVLNAQLAPAALPARVDAELEVGERLDADADRIGRGARWKLEAQLQGQVPNGWSLASTQGIEHGVIAAPDGRRSLAESALRWAGVVQFGARDSVQLNWQRSRAERREDPSAGLAGASASMQELTLAFRHRAAAGWDYSLGITRQSAGTMQHLLFAKLSLQLGR